MQPDEAKLVRIGIYLFGVTIFCIVAGFQYSTRSSNPLEIWEVLAVGFCMLVGSVVWLRRAYRKMNEARNKRVDELLKRKGAEI